MNAKRFNLLLIATLTLLLLSIFGAVIGGNIILKKQSDKLTQLKINSKAIDHQHVLLTQAKRDIEKYSELDKIARSIVPQDKDQAKTVREITAIANQNSIPIKSIDFPASTLGSALPKVPVGGEGAAAVPAPAAPAISQVKPLPNIPGIYTLEIQVTSGGEVSYRNLIGFLEGLENNRRTAHVTKINLDPSKDGRGIKFILTLSAYLKP